MRRQVGGPYDRIEKRDLYEQMRSRNIGSSILKAETVEALFLVDQQYELINRWRTQESASSRLLPGFQVGVDYLFKGAEQRSGGRHINRYIGANLRSSIGTEAAARASSRESSR